MRRYIVVILLFISNIFAYNYDNILLKAQSDIYPKIILLDKDINKKITNNTIIFTIIHHETDRLKSQKLKQSIQKNYHNKLGNFNFIVKTITFDQLNTNDNSTAYFLLNAPINQIKKACEVAQKKHTILFSYELNHFDLGALISLKIENEPKIYLNKKVHKRYMINFKDILYQIVRFKND